MVDPITPPSNIGFGTVVWQVADWQTDSSDGGDIPDFNALTGTVTFTPTVSFVNDATADPNPLTLAGDVITGTLGPDGYLGVQNGMVFTAGVKLPATNDPDTNPTDFAYRVDFTLRNSANKQVRLPSFNIAVPEGETVDLALTLTPPSAEPESLAAAEAAAAIAAQAALDAQAAAEAAEGVAVGISPSGDTTGVTDTATIQAAINAASTAGGGTVRLSSGVFYAKGLLIKSKVHLVGVGVEATTLRLPAAANVDLISVPNFGTLTGTNSQDGEYKFGLNGLTLDGNGSAQSGACWPLRVYGWDYFVQDVEIIKGYSGNFYSEWGTGGGAFTHMEANISSLKLNSPSTAGAVNLDWRGPHDSILSDVIIVAKQDAGPSGVANQVGLWTRGNAGGEKLEGLHIWGYHKYAFVAEKTYVAANCTLEGAYLANLVQCTANSVYEGRIFGTNDHNTGEVGVQLGQTPTFTNIRNNLFILCAFGFGPTSGLVNWQSSGGGNTFMGTYVRGTSLGVNTNGTGPQARDTVQLQDGASTADGEAGQWGRPLLITAPSNTALRVGIGTAPTMSVNTNNVAMDLPNNAKLRGYSGNYSNQTYQLDSSDGSLRLGTTAGMAARLWSGSGAPTTPGGAITYNLGDLYIRTGATSSPTTRIYLVTTAGTSPTWSNLFDLLDTDGTLAANSDAKVATQKAVKTAIQAAIDGLVAAAPGTLDTLNELATALGDDPNFATTITTALAGKQPLDSDLTTIAALDSTTAGALTTDGAGWIRKTYAQLKTALSLTKSDVGLGSVDNVQQQPLDATLTALAGLATGADQLPYSTGTDTFAQTALTSFIRTLLDDADAATARTTLSAFASTGGNIDGDTTVIATSGSRQLAVRTVANQSATLAFLTSANGRWLVRKSTDTESGSNTGADFEIVARTDAGGALSTPFRIIRSTGQVQATVYPIKVLSAVTGSRPAASAAGVGAMMFDITLAKPIWSDGTNWKDATGTNV